MYAMGDFFHLVLIPCIHYQSTWPKWAIAAFEFNGEPLNIDCIPRKLDRSMMTVESVIQKENMFSRNILHYGQLDVELAVLNFSVS